MCGIAGSIGLKRYNSKNINDCLKLMKNRGPDFSSYKKISINEKFKVNLLHSRLSIIDLKARSNQPYIKKQFILIFNGEIYNYLELKKKLESLNHKFKTNSDTEVLISAYEQFGEECVKYFEGMWSFAIWDNKKKKLFLSRDRFGEKPLYYYKSHNTLYFGSEPKFIKSLSKDYFQINKNKIYSQLHNGYKSIYSDSESYFSKIYSVKPGTSLIYDVNLNQKKIRYWKPKFIQNKKISLNEAKEMTSFYLDKSLKYRLRSDVPIAFCLSGGIDSSLLASLAVKKFNSKIKTFSIIDSDKRYNELSNINRTISDLKCDNHKIYINKENSLENLKNLIEYHQQPIPTISYLIHSYLSKEISEDGFKVSISGTGADEIFSGYYHHFQFFFQQFKKNSDTYKSNLKYWKKFIHPFIRDRRLKKNNFIREKIDFLFNKKRPNLIKPRYFSSDSLRNKMINEMFYEVVPVILNSDDLNSMYYSIENRSPFLDKDLFEISNTIPTKYLISSGYQKFLLREISEEILTNKVRLDRQKKGFNASFSSLFDSNDHQMQEYLFESKNEINEIINFKKLKKELKNKTISNELSKFLFNLLNINIFTEKFR